MHDIIAIGGSAGSIRVIKEILSKLPVALPATVFIVNHIGPTVSLRTIFSGVSVLPVKEAATGKRIERGQVYVAVPNAHLLVERDHLIVRRGPRENFARPAIDPLFRSAASAFGSRVIGVILSGGLNDGAAGLAAIKKCGGLAVVQDPSDAEVPAMPDSALHAVEADYCIPAAQIASLLTRLVDLPVGHDEPAAAGARQRQRPKLAH